MEKEMKIYLVETQEDYDDLVIKLEEEGYKWASGNKPTSKYYWEVCYENTYVVAYEGDKTIGFGHVDDIKFRFPNKTDKAKELQKYSEQIAKKKEDLVNHPAHYNQYSQEVIDTIEEVRLICL